MADSPIQRGLNVLIPSVHNTADDYIKVFGTKPINDVAQTSPKISEELNSISEKVKREVDQKSGVNIYNEDGSYNSDANITDGDSIKLNSNTKANRISYDRDNPEDIGKSYDAWETDHGEEWLKEPANQKRMVRQRRAYAALLHETTPSKVTPEQLAKVTNDHVYAMGEATLQRAKQFGSTLTEVPGSGNVDKYGRSLGGTYLNDKGEDIREFLNTPLDNANYFSKYNPAGRDTLEQGSKRTRKGETVSDYDVKNTNLGFGANVAESLAAGVTGLAGDVGDFVATGIAGLNEGVKPELGNTAITPKTKALYASIKTKSDLATKQAQLEYDKELAQTRSGRIENIKNIALNSLDTQDPSAILNINKGITSVKDRADRILAKELTLDEYRLVHGKGDNTNILGLQEPRKSIGNKLNPIQAALKPKVKDDRYKTLEAQRKVRRDVNTALRTGNKTNNILEPKATKEFKKDQHASKLVSPVTGAPKDTSRLNNVLGKEADLSVATYKKEADNLYDEGKEIQAAAKWIQGGASRLFNNPGTSVTEALGSLPHMASMITAPTLAIGASVNKSITENTEKFYKQNGKYPNQQEANNIVIGAVGKGLIQKFGAEALIGKPGKVAGKALTKFISSRLGTTAGMSTTFAAGTLLEGGEEVLEGILDQVVVNQGTGKKLDTNELYKQWTIGISAGGATKASMQSAGMPAAVIQDVLKIGGRLGKGAIVTGKLAAGKVFNTKSTSEQLEKAKTKVVENVAKSANTTAEEVLTPNVVVPEGTEVHFNEEAIPSQEESTKPTFEEASQSLDKAYDDLGNIPDTGLDTSKDILKTTDIINSASYALQNYIQSFTPETMTDEILADIEERQKILDQVNLQVKNAKESISDESVVTLKKTSDIAEVITRGSAGIAEVDTTELSGELQTMVSELSEYDRQLKTVLDSKPAAMKEVRGEVLGTRTNEKQKAGLGQHLANLGTAIVNDNLENAHNAIRSISNFKNLQQAKHDAISKGYKEFQKTGQEVTVTYGNNSEWIITGDDTKGALDYIQKEIDIITKAEKLGGNLGEAHFYPADYSKRIKEETKQKPKAETTNEPVATPVDVQVNVPAVRASLERRIGDIEAQLNDNPSVAKRSDLIQKQNKLNNQLSDLNIANPIPEVQETEVTVNEPSEAGEVKAVDEVTEPEPLILTPTESEPSARTRKEIYAEGLDIKKQLLTIDDEIKAATTQTAKAGLRAEKANLIKQREELNKEYKATPVKKKSKERTVNIPNKETKKEDTYNIQEVEDITNKEGEHYTHVLGRVNYDTKTIELNQNKKLLEKVYKNKPWTKSRVREDGTTSIGLPADTFPTLADFKEFILQHEIGHVVLGNKRENENEVEYEARVNNYALKAMNIPNPNEKHNTEVSNILDGIINDLPAVEPKPKIDKPSKIEKQQQNNLFSLAAIGEDLDNKKTLSREAVSRAPVLKSLLKYSSKVKQQASKADVNSTNKLRPLREMLTAVQEQKHIRSIIGTTSDLFTTLKEMSDSRFTNKEWGAIKTIEQFSTEFSEAIDSILPAIYTSKEIAEAKKKGIKLKNKGLQPSHNDAKKIIVFKQLANRSPVFQFMNEDGDLAPEVKTAMSVAMLDWVQSNGSASMFQTPADIYRFFGMDENQGGLSDATLNTLGSMGMHLQPQAATVGQAILKYLNIKQDTSNPDLDGGWQTRLEQSLGDMAFVAMANITTSAEKGNSNRGYIKRKAIPIKLLNEMAGKEVFDINGDPKATFVQIPLQLDSNGNPLINPKTKKYILGRSLQQLMDLINQPEFKSVMKAITGVRRTEGGVTAIPNTKAPKYRTGTSTELDPVQKEYVETLNAQTLVQNPQWNLMESFLDNQGEWLKMHGWVEPTINSKGEATFPKMHEAEAISALGKNLGLERELKQMLEHKAEWEAGILEVKAEIAAVSAQMLLIDLRGEHTGKISRKLAKLEDELRAYEAGDIHLNHHVIATGRVNDKTGTLSIQRSKMHRNALSFKDHVETIDITNPIHRAAVIASLIEPLGLDAKLFSNDAEFEFSRDFMDSRGNAKDEVIRLGVESIQAQQELGKITKEQQEAITKAVLQLGEGPHSLNGLMTLAAWSSAIKAGETTFESYGYIEVDGTTNGVIASVRQLLGGYDPDNKDPEEGSKTKRIRDLLNAGGLIFSDQDYKEGIDFLKEDNHWDAYQNIAVISSERLEPVARTVKDIPVKTLRSNTTTAYTQLGLVKDKGDQTEIKEAEDNLSKAETELGMKVFKDTLPEFGEITSKLRTMMKAIVMPGGYQAGDTALTNALFKAWLDNQYHNMGQGNLDNINATLKLAGLPPVKSENSKKVFPKQSLKKLKRLYTSSVGKEIVAAYRESMGQEFNENAKLVNSAVGLMAVIVTDVLNKNFGKLERKKGSPLSNKEKMDERKRAQKEDGLFVGFKHLGATGFGDSTSIIRDEKVEVSEERGGYVFSAFAEESILTDNYYVNDKGILSVTKDVKTSSTTSRIKENIPSADVGVRGMLTANIGIDAYTNAMSTINGGVAGNIFDAKLLGILGAAQETKNTNAVWDSVFRNWSMWDAVGDQLEHIVSNYPDAALLELNEFFTPYEKDLKTGEEYGNKFAPTYTTDDGLELPFVGVQEFMEYYKERQIRGNKQREALNKNTVGVAQYYTPGGTAKVSNTSNTRGSSDEQIDITEFENVMRNKATPERVSALFNKYIESNNVEDSKQHTNRLKELMNKYILPLVRESTGYTISTKQGPGTTGGAVQGENVYIRTSDKATRLFSTDMSDAEVLTHEFLHPIVEAGLKDNITSIKELRALQKQAIESKSFTVDSLIDPKDLDQVTARKKAQRLYDYITGDIHEFMVFGLSNNVVRSALENETVTTKEKGIVDKLLDVLSNLVKLLTGQVVGRTAEPTNIASSLDTLINGFDTTTRVHMARRVASVVDNDFVNAGRGFLADTVGKPLMAWGRKASYKVPVGDPNSNPSIKETVSSLAKAPFRTFDTGFQKEMVNISRSVTSYKTDFFSKLARETVGSEIENKTYVRKLSEVNEHVESAALRTAKGVHDVVKNSFSRSLSTSEQKMLADTLLRGDMKVFKGMNPEELIELVSDSDVLNSSIKSTLNSLKSSDKNWINSQAKNLGSVMIQGKANIRDGNLNAFNIASGLSAPNKNAILMADEQTIDKLKSLYAIKYMPIEQRNQLAQMVSKEPQGINTILEVDSVNHAETLATTYVGDKSKVIAGEVISKSTNRSRTVILPSRDHNKHTQAGFTLVKSLGPKLGLYSKTNVPTEGYQKGIFSMGNTELEGTPVKRADRQGNELPIVSGGRIIGYRAVMDKETRELEAGMSIGVTESLGNQAARTLRLSRGDTFNNQVVNMAYQDFLINGSKNSRAFIRISTNSNNPQVAEFARLIPREMRKAIKEQWNGDMYLRKNQLDLLIGYRKLSLVDTINQRRVLRGDSEMPTAISGSITLAGDVWQGAVSEVKRRTVLFTPAVVVGNFISNLAVSVLHGMNPVDVIRDQREGYRAIKAYTKWQDEIVALDLQINIGNDVKANKREKARVEQAMKSSGIHNMIEAGMFQSIIEDIDISAGNEASPLNTVLQRALPENITEATENAYRAAPDSIKKGIGIMMLSPSTEFGANVQAATAYADFSARYAMLKHLKNTGMSETKAMDEVRDIYVDYAPNTSKELQYINDSGLFMYTKFMLRIQRVIMRAMRNHPEAVLALEAAQQMTGNISDITDASLLWGISLQGGRTLTPDEALDTLTQLPLLHMIFGLKETF